MEDAGTSFQIVLNRSWDEPLKQQYEITSSPLEVFAPKNNWNKLKKYLGFKYEDVCIGYEYNIKLK